MHEESFERENLRISADVSSADFANRAYSLSRNGMVRRISELKRARTKTLRERIMCTWHVAAKFCLLVRRHARRDSLCYPRLNPRFFQIALISRTWRDNVDNVSYNNGRLVDLTRFSP